MSKKSRNKGKSNVVNVNRHAGDFKLSSSTSIGTADATQDRLLSETFFDNGALGNLTDVFSPESLIVGRTGAGKTALIEKLLETQPHVINIDPDHLSLGYLVDSSLLRFFYDSGVKMDLFYKLLWNHIFIVEILRERYDINNEINRVGMFSRFSDFITGNKGRTEAINYLFEWGDKFWLGTEERVKEVIDKLERQIQDNVGLEAKIAIPKIMDSNIKLDHKSDYKIAEEIKTEIINRGREVVSRIQTRRIQELVSLMDKEILSDRQKRYYITIDRLDENWVNDELRYQLIKSLIEVSRDLNNKIGNLKITIALRQDLIARVFEKTQDSGFQEEKFQSLYVDLYWSTKELNNLIQLRVNKIIDQSPNSKSIRMQDILPSNVNGMNPIEYMIERTMLRPRDLILFFNAAIKIAAGKHSIAAHDITQAEIEYSQSRFKALQHEWGVDYENLTNVIGFLRGYPPTFTIGEILDRFRDSSMDLITRGSTKQDTLFNIINDNINDESKQIYMVEECFEILFRVGAIGIRPVKQSTVYWSFKRQFNIHPPVAAKSVYYIHPCLWSALSIKFVTTNMGIV